MSRRGRGDAPTSGPGSHRGLFDGSPEPRPPSRHDPHHHQRPPSRQQPHPHDHRTPRDRPSTHAPGAPAPPYFADRSPGGDYYGSPGLSAAHGGHGGHGGRDTGGAGGLAGLHDPYDRPTRSHLAAAQSRLRQDKASGALMEVAGRYRTLFGTHHLVRKGLRRSIADAYAAYVGQVVSLPDDVYGMALFALDRTFNHPRQPNGTASCDFLLQTSPFATARSKHAQIFNTAHKIMRDLEGYVYDVSYYCPQELDELRNTRRPGASEAAGGEGYKARPASGPAVEGGPIPLTREAVPVTPRQPAGASSRRRQRYADQSASPDVNPMTGSSLRHSGFASRGGARRDDPHGQGGGGRYDSPGSEGDADGRRSGGRVAGVRPRTAPGAGAGAGRGRHGGGGAGGGVAAAERDVAGALAAAREAEEAEGDGAGGPEERHDWAQRRSMHRMSSPGMFVRTPPHYRIARCYDHISPTKDVLDFMRKHALAKAQRMQQAAAEAAQQGQHAPATAAAAAAQELAAVAAMEQVLGVGTQQGAAGGAAGAAPGPAPAMPGAATTITAGQSPDPQHGRHPQVSQQPRSRSASGGGSRSPTGSRHASPERAKLRPADPRVTSDRIWWIVDSAFELGLAEALGLEGPPPYGRSARVSPLYHRRVHYEGLYSSPQRYTAAHPHVHEEAAAAAAGAGGGPVAPVTPPPPAYYGQVGDAAAGGDREQFVPYSGGGGRYGSPAGAAPARRGHGRGWQPPPGWQGPTAQAVYVADARRFVREQGPEPEAKRYPRSARLSPW